MSAFGILCYDNQATPQFRGNLKERATGLRATTVLPGGCGELTFRVHERPDIVPVWLGFNYEVRVTDTQGIWWTGRIADAVADDDGGFWEVKAQGYAINLDDQFYTSTDVSGDGTNTVISDAITSLTQQIDSTDIATTSFSLSGAAAVNLKMMVGWQVVNWAAKFGDSGNNPQLWYVYPTDAGSVVFTFKDRPTTADLTGYRKDFEGARWGFRGRTLGNGVVVQYNGGASFATVNDTALQGAGPAGWGVTRRIPIVAPEISQSADATQLANAILERVSTVRLTAQPFRVRPSARLRDSNGAGVAPHRIRAGQLLRFADINPADGTAASNLTWSNSALIVGTQYDEDSQTVTITPENNEETLEQIVAQARTLLRGRHTLSGAA